MLSSISTRTSRKIRTLGLGILLSLPAGYAQADTHATYYRYRDENGVLHITNVRPSDPAWQSWDIKAEISPVPILRDTSADPSTDAVPKRAQHYHSLIEQAAQSYGIDPALIRAVIHTESRYNPRAVSSKGAQGMMQLMPSAAEFLGVDAPFDPEQNIMGGTKYLRLLSDRFAGDTVLMLAGYHAGAGAVRKYGGVPPYASTRAYIQAVMRRYEMYAKR